MSRQRGMTLVELLIIFAIVGLLVSLVSPSSAKLLDKAKAQEEWLVLDRTIDSLAFNAYAGAKVVTIKADGKVLEWTIGGKPAGALTLSYLNFPAPQVVTINPNGVASPDKMIVVQVDRERSIPLNRWIGSSS